MLMTDIHNDTLIPEEEKVKLIKQGEWQMFELITSTYYGKKYYFLEPNGIVYSRASSSYLFVNDAIKEFLSAIGDY